jgi:hypothetical protein
MRNVENKRPLNDVKSFFKKWNNALPTLPLRR